jgi:HPt (histidine-containing phosphotransfer) domain-containing protein
MATLLDFQRLATFTDGDPGLEAELLELFVATAAGYLDELREAVNDTDSRADRWQATAHSLKGAAGNIGAVAMAELAAAAEQAAPDPEMLAAIAATFAATQASLRERAA